MYVLTATNLTTVVDNRPVTVPSSHPSFTQIKAAVIAGEDPTPFLSIPKVFAEFTGGRVVVSGRDVTFNGEPLHSGLATRVADFVAADQPELAEPLCNFLDKLSENPSFRAQRGLFDWLENSKLPIASDGRVVAWKLVRDNFFDIRTGTFDNTPGKTVEMPRHKVDEDPNVTCSSGLHICSESYLPHYGSSDSRIVMCLIDPADWVSVPIDYNLAKARVCKYEVVCEVPREQVSSYFAGSEYVHDFTQADEDREENEPVEDDDVELVESVIAVLDEDFIEVETNRDIYQVPLDAACFGSNWTVGDFKSVDIGEQQRGIRFTLSDPLLPEWTTTLEAIKNHRN